jgi:hypothetical protein
MGDLNPYQCVVSYNYPLVDDLSYVSGNLIQEPAFLIQRAMQALAGLY